MRRNRCQNHVEARSVRCEIESQQNLSEDIPADNSSERMDIPPLNPTLGELPLLEIASSTSFRWGNRDGESFTEAINRANEETVKWKSNLFEVPRGKAGTSFVRELSCLTDAYSDATAMEGIALKTAMVLPALVLQKPSPKSKSKECSLRLEERLTRWAEGDVESLLHKGQTFQIRMPHSE